MNQEYGGVLWVLHRFGLLARFVVLSILSIFAKVLEAALKGFAWVFHLVFLGKREKLQLSWDVWAWRPDRRSAETVQKENPWYVASFGSIITVSVVNLFVPFHSPILGFVFACGFMFALLYGLHRFLYELSAQYQGSDS